MVQSTRYEVQSMDSDSYSILRLDTPKKYRMSNADWRIMK
jgi:hypothetical protein